MTGISTPERAPSIQERIRGMSLPELLRLARSGDVTERAALERMHGKLVWDALLHNPCLTIPEVVRIANNGTLPRPLIQVIVSNDAWLTSPVVRHALLSNPRLQGTGLTRILRSTPRAELLELVKRSGVPYSVREAAKRTLRGG